MPLYCTNTTQVLLQDESVNGTLNNQSCAGEFKVELLLQNSWTFLRELNTLQTDIGIDESTFIIYT